MKKQIDYYGETDNYIHLKWGDCVKMYNFTDKFIKDYPYFTEQYRKYWDCDETCDFKDVSDVVNYVFKNKIPVHFYFNFTDTPAKSKKEIINWINDNK